MASRSPVADERPGIDGALEIVVSSSVQDWSRSVMSLPRRGATSCITAAAKLRRPGGGAPLPNPVVTGRGVQIGAPARARAVRLRRPCAARGAHLVGPVLDRTSVGDALQ